MNEEWQPRQRVTNLYRRIIFDLLKKFFDIPEDATLEDIQQRMQEHEPVSEFLDRYATEAATGMVTTLYTQNARNWREAATKSTRGPLIRGMLREELKGRVGAVIRDKVRQNANLIRTLPRDLALEVTQFIAREHLKGVRATTLAEQMRRELPRKLWSRASLIARTEVSKASTALTRARSEEIDADYYLWRTSMDGRVRESHRKMANVICKFGDDPAPELLVGEKFAGFYGPGELYNCRCYPEPLLAFNQTSWPAKVYTPGKIVYLTLAAFKKQLPPQQLRQLIA